MHNIRIDLPESVRSAMIELLQARLADAVDLSTQAKQAHWNVKGPNFISLHQLFDDVTDSARDYSDTMAERITALGGTAEGTARVAAARSTLAEYPLHINEGVAHAAALADALAAFGKLVRANIAAAEGAGDADTADIFTEVSRGTDKILWMVEAHLQADR